MRFLILVFILCLQLVASDNIQVLMDSISKEAIRIGNGADKVYVFVDPLCPKSRNFISLINEREDLQQKRSYYIFLYQLKQFDSFKLIQFIYQSESPRSELIDIMVYGDEPDFGGFIVNKKTINTIKDVEKVGKKLGIKRRPYLLIFEEGSKYCRVSEGTAPCLEDEDFD